MMSVSSLNTKIKSLLEATFMHTMVEGEVASATYHTSGHLYFSIKDKNSSIKCVMWRSAVSKMKFRIEKGMHIVVEGSVSVYVPRGEYQFQTVRIEPYGQGVLALAYEQLKQKLGDKGYFDAHIKKQIPTYLSKIALVTASGGAALQDMLKVAQKRWALVEIIVIDVLVQGDSAAMEIAKGIEYANGLGVDAIVVGRGGGSSEDLWAFNEEVVADAIFASATPVVSAVGHEVDMLISDFVADMRAPTPSAAMEMILPDSDEALYMLNDRVEQSRRRVTQVVAHKGEELSRLRAEMIRSSVLGKLKNIDKQFSTLRDDFSSAVQYKLAQFDIKISPERERLEENLAYIIRKKLGDIASLRDRFELSDPTKQMKFSWAQINIDGKKASLEDIEIGDEFDIVNAKVKVHVRGLEKKKL